MDGAFLYTLGPSGFDTPRSIVSGSYGVLWLSCGGVIDTSMPQRALVQGLFRTLRRENASKRYAHLDFESSTSPWTTEMVGHAVHVYREAFGQSKDTTITRMNWEYVAKDGLLHVPRLWPDFTQDDVLCQRPSSTQRRPWREEGRELVWEVPEAWQNLMRFIEQSAFGISFQDVMTAMGLIEADSDFVGHESAGIVTQLGRNAVESRLRIGDPICGIFRGRFASRAQARWTRAVAVPYAYGTAHLALHHVARLQRGKCILIHSAAGALGQAAIVLAQHMQRRPLDEPL